MIGYNVSKDLQDPGGGQLWPLQLIRKEQSYLFLDCCSLCICNVECYLSINGTDKKIRVFRTFIPRSFYLHVFYAYDKKYIVARRHALQG